VNTRHISGGRRLPQRILDRPLPLLRTGRPDGGRMEDRERSALTESSDLPGEERLPEQAQLFEGGGRNSVDQPQLLERGGRENSFGEIVEPGKRLCRLNFPPDLPGQASEPLFELADEYPLQCLAFTLCLEPL